MKHVGLVTLLCHRSIACMLLPVPLLQVLVLPWGGFVSS